MAYLDNNGVLYLWGKIKSLVSSAVAGFYTKPSGGIPKSDLAADVQTSLGKADTALQSAPVTSVNNKTGAVTLGASDVHALPDSTVIPSVPQMATDPDMSDWTSGKTVDAAVLKNGVQYIERTIEGKADASALENYALKSDISSMYKYKGSVATVSDLPSSGVESGWVYNVESTGMNYAWNGTAWDALGESFQITAITNAEIDEICT